jgi:hypothetical protein
MGDNLNEMNPPSNNTISDILSAFPNYTASMPTIGPPNKVGYTGAPIPMFQLQQHPAPSCIPPHPKPTKRKKEKTFPSELDGGEADSNFNYSASLTDQNLMVSPRTVCFLPLSSFSEPSIKFGDLVSGFFQRKNNSNCRFPLQLFNALALVKYNSSYWPLVGAM